MRFTPSTSLVEESMRHKEVMRQLKDALDAAAAFERHAEAFSSTASPTKSAPGSAVAAMLVIAAVPLVLAILFTIIFSLRRRKPLGAKQPAHELRAVATPAAVAAFDGELVLEIIHAQTLLAERKKAGWTARRRNPLSAVCSRWALPGYAKRAQEARSQRQLRAVDRPASMVLKLPPSAAVLPGGGRVPLSAIVVENGDQLWHQLSGSCAPTELTGATARSRPAPAA